MWYSTSSWGNLAIEALKYGTHFQGITQFYLPPTHLSMNGMNHTCLCLPSQSWSSFINPRAMEGWVGLDTTMVSRQSAQDHYVIKITVISCSDCHASPGNWKRSRYERQTHDLRLKATNLTTTPSSHPKEHSIKNNLPLQSDILPGNRLCLFLQPEPINTAVSAIWHSHVDWTSMK